LIASWQALSRAPVYEDAPTFFPRSKYSLAMQTFLEAVQAVQEGTRDVEDLPPLLESLSGAGQVRDWMRGDHAEMAAEVAGTRRGLEEIGKHATSSLFTEADPVKASALRATRTLAAVFLDSIQNYPTIMANAFAHRAVAEAVQDLCEAVRSRT
jgi:hypothetical protein